MSEEEIKNKTVKVVVPMFISESQLNADQVKRIELETKGQHKNYLWRQHRVGRITASNFHQSMYTKTESIMKNRSKSSKSKQQYSPMVFNIIHESEDLTHNGEPFMKMMGLSFLCQTLLVNMKEALKAMKSEACMLKLPTHILLVLLMAVFHANVVIQQLLNVHIQ